MVHKQYENKKTGYRKEAIPSELRWRIWERDNFTCLHCGSRAKLTIDHILPESMGGDLSENNLQTLCWPCNRRKGTKLPGQQGLKLSWHELTLMDPRLGDLMDEIRALKDDPAKTFFCANAHWYGYAERDPEIGNWKPGYKRRMAILVGVSSENYGPLRTREAWDLAYEMLYEALPNCRNCSCG